ncbi:chaplin [Streptomyces sp. NPDC091272]|uniref:chaplin n=1 Tax=Streptomyces sp. NPDC091272 TaxID=3365981 RepID=UPI003805BD92
MRPLAHTAVLTMAAAGALIGATGTASADADAQGATGNAPGILSGNLDQIPVHVAVNDCGNTLNVVGILNPAFGNTCAAE